MSRIAACFKNLASQNRKALIPYITAGDSSPKLTVPLMHAMVSAGADIIELGVPFSDPMADGPAIQAACERALAFNVSLMDVLGMVAEFRKQNANTPVVLMGYLNPVEVMGYALFSQRAAEAGVDGVLTVDMPPEEADELLVAFESKGIDPIFLISPDSTVDRFKLIAEKSRGFIYYVSLKGVTGVKSIDTDMVKTKVKTLKAFTDLPIGVGFGIKDAESAAAVSTAADGVVVGSAIIKRIAEAADDQEKILTEVSEFLTGLRQAMDNVTGKSL